MHDVCTEGALQGSDAAAHRCSVVATHRHCTLHDHSHTKQALNTASESDGGATQRGTHSNSSSLLRWRPSHDEDAQAPRHGLDTDHGHGPQLKHCRSHAVLAV
jgi:hypothetical protein